MGLTITSASVAAACAAANSQIAWVYSLLAPWDGLSVTARIEAAGGVVRETLTLAPWRIDTSGAVVGVRPGLRTARTHVSPGSIAKLVFAADGVDIFEYDAGVTGSGASVTFAQVVKALCRPKVDAVLITAPAGLQKFNSSESELSTTVVNLAANVTTAGFHTLTTTPSATPAKNYITVHQGSCFVPERGAVYLYGDETHNNNTQFGNAPYRFDLATGRVYRETAPDPWPGGYRFDNDGRAFATAAKNTPWASHGQRQIVRIHDTTRWLLAYPTSEHAFWTGQINEGAATTEKPMLWAFDYARNSWSYIDGGGGSAWDNIDDFLTANVGYAVVYHPARNSLISWIGSFLRELSLSTYALTSTGTSPGSSSFNTYSFVLPDNTLLVAGGANVAATQLYAILNPDSPASATRVLQSSVAALSGYQMNNTPWVNIGGWEFVVLAKDETNVQMRAFRFNAQTGVWTDTGHTWAADSTIVSANGHYWLMADYVPAHDLVTFAMRLGSVSGWYAYKPTR
jgi:hypothetical protein